MRQINTDHRLKEYEILRAEILFFMNKDTSLFVCLFTSVISILFFSIEWEIPEGCILTFLIIIPIGSKFAYHQKEMAKISAYIKKYLETEIDIKWETFVTEIASCSTRPRTSKYMKFSECTMMAVASILAYAFLAWNGSMWEKHKYIFGFEIIVLLILFMWTMLISKDIYSMKKHRSDYEKIMNNIEI